MLKTSPDLRTSSCTTILLLQFCYRNWRLVTCDLTNMTNIVTCLPVLFLVLLLIDYSASLRCRQCGHASGNYFKEYKAFECKDETEWDCDNPTTTTPGPTEPPPPPPPPPLPTTEGTTETTTAGPTTTTGPPTTTGTTTTTTPAPPPPPRDLVKVDPNAPWKCESWFSAGGVMRRCVRTNDKNGCITLGRDKSCLCDTDECNNAKNHKNGTGSRKPSHGLLWSFLMTGRIIMTFHVQ